jgi:hypothetical protein
VLKSSCSAQISAPGRLDQHTTTANKPSGAPTDGYWGDPVEGSGPTLVSPTEWTRKSDLGQGAFCRQIAQADQLYTDEVQDRCGEISIPTLVCWGEEDTWIPTARGHELIARIPDARLELIAGAGHLVQEDAPAELTAGLIAFLQHHHITEVRCRPRLGAEPTATLGTVHGNARRTHQRQHAHDTYRTGSSSGSSRSLPSARDTADLTVPTDTPSTSAVCTSLRSS